MVVKTRDVQNITVVLRMCSIDGSGIVSFDEEGVDRKGSVLRSDVEALIFPKRLAVRCCTGRVDAAADSP
jgi:hypothetical protein